MIKKQKNKKINNPVGNSRLKVDPDTIYVIKLIVVMILGFIWLKISNNFSWQVPLPIGAVLGIVYIRKQRLKTDRKMLYGVLLLAMLVGFWAPLGLFLNI